MKDQRRKRAGFSPVEWVLLGGIAVVGLLLPGPKTPMTDSTPPQVEERTVVQSADPGPVQTAAPKFWKQPADCGIEVVALNRAVNGRVIDLRYKIVDVAKAAQLPDDSGRIYLLDETTGARSTLPNSLKTGSIPQNPQKLQTGRVYSLSFPNPGQRFAAGSKMTLIMGSFRAENLTIQ